MLRRSAAVAVVLCALALPSAAQTAPTFTLSNLNTDDDQTGVQTGAALSACNANDAGQTCATATATLLSGTGVTALSLNPGTGQLSYTVTGAGVATVQVTVTDSNGDVSAAKTMTVTVAKRNLPPIVSLGGTTCVRGGAAACGARTNKEDDPAVTQAGWIVVDTQDATDMPAQTVAVDITCTPTSYACTGHPDCGSPVFAAGPSATNCRMAGTVQTCDLEYTLGPDEFTEGLQPGEVTCTVRARDSGGANPCTAPGGGPCHTTTATFTVKVTPVNDKPTFTVTPGLSVKVKEDCGCWPARSTCGTTAQQQASSVLKNVVAGPYNEIVFEKQTVTVARVTTSDDTAFEVLPNGDRITVDDMGNVFFMLAPHRNGIGPGPGVINSAFVATVVLTDDGVTPCITTCTNPRTADNQPLESDPATFTIEAEEVNDPPYVELSHRVVNVNEDCTGVDLNDFLRQVTAGQGPFGAPPGNYPTQEERLQTVTMSGLTLSPASANSVFTTTPSLSSTGPFSSAQRNRANLRFDCKPDMSTTHPYNPACGTPPPNYSPGGVPAPGGWPYDPLGAGGGILANSPTGAVRVSMTFTDDGANDGCSVGTSTIEFDIVINEVNDPPSYTTRPIPHIEIYEDSFGVVPGGGLQCRSPLDTDAHPCGAESPKELKIKDWIDTFSTGNDQEDQFENLNWLFTMDHGEYFRDGPKIDQYKCPLVDDMKALRLTLEPHATGTARVYVDCEDTGVPSLRCGETLFRIEIAAVNDPPDACPAMNRVEYEECALVTGCAIEERWLVEINPGGGDDERHQQVSATCDWGPKGTTPAEKAKELFTGSVGLDVHSGDVSFTLKEYVSGTGWIECELKDTGGVGATLKADGTPCDMDAWTFRLEVVVKEVNNPPTFDFGSHTSGQDLIIEEDSNAQVILGFATKLSPSGDPSEKDQTLAFTCAADDVSLFAAPPTLAVQAAGTEADLSIAPAADAYGTTTVRCVLKDSGSCTVRDCDSEGSFRVTITPVNDPPLLTLPADTLRLYSDGSDTSTPGAVTGVPGPPNEAHQTLRYHVAINGPGAELFTVPPEILPDGRLQYSLVPGAAGEVTLEITAQDDGGGRDTSDPVYLKVVVAKVNTPPTFELSVRDVVVYLDGMVTEHAVATNVDAGGQGHSFELAGYDAALFAAPLEMDADGVLSVHPRAVGVTPVRVRAVDDGPACPAVTATCRDVAASAYLDFVVQVLAKAPLRFTAGAPVGVDEDSGAYDAEYATGIAGGGGNASGLTFTVDGYPPALFTSAGLSIDPATGALSFTPAADASGEAAFRACLEDGAGGKVCKGGRVAVAPVNDAPSFALRRRTVVVPLTETAHTLEGVVSGLTAGPGDEPTQQTVSLAAVPEEKCRGAFQGGVVNFDGSVTAMLVRLTPQAQVGSCVVVVTATDSLGGVLVEELTLELVDVLAKPTFDAANDVFVRPRPADAATSELAVPEAIPFATNIGGGGDGEGFFLVTYNQAQAERMFGPDPANHPTIDAAGVLRFRPLLNRAADEKLELFVTLKRSTSDGDNLLQSDTVRRTLVLVAQGTYLTPRVVVPVLLTQDEDAGPQTVPNWCSLRNVTAQTTGYTLSVAASSPAFATPPRVVHEPYPRCDLVYETARDFYGDVDVTLRFRDARNLLAESTTLRVRPVNDAPFTVVSELHRVVHVDLSVPLPVSAVTTLHRTTLLAPFYLAVSKGAENEAGQELRFVVEAFAASPAGFFSPDSPPQLLHSDTSLRVTTREVEGSGVVTLTAHDSGVPSRQSETDTIHIYASAHVAYVEVGVAAGGDAGNGSTALARNAAVRRLRDAVGTLAGVAPLRVAVHSYGTGDPARAVVSVIRRPDGSAAATAEEATRALLAAGEVALDAKGLQFARATTGAGGGGGGGGGVPGGPDPPGGNQGGGGGGSDGGYSVPWLLVVATSVVGVALFAAAAFVVRKVCFGGGEGGKALEEGSARGSDASLQQSSTESTDGAGEVEMRPSNSQDVDVLSSDGLGGAPADSNPIENVFPSEQSQSPSRQMLQ